MFELVGKLKVTFVALALVLVSLPAAVVAGGEGCVACHVDSLALNTLLTDRIEAHPDIGAMVNTIPSDCVMCHAKGSPMALMQVVHARHEGMPCDTCHVVDAETGVPASVKTSPKNW